MSRVDIEQTYKKWWVGKKVRRCHQDCEFKKVVDLHFSASPSGMVGVVTLIFEDGGELTLGGGVNSFRPRKKDIEIEGDCVRARIK